MSDSIDYFDFAATTVRAQAQEAVAPQAPFYPRPPLDRADAVAQLDALSEQIGALRCGFPLTPAQDRRLMAAQEHIDGVWDELRQGLDIETL